MLEQHAPPAPIPGWYRDPDDPTGHRYWNGEVWLAADEVAAREPATRQDLDQPDDAEPRFG